MGVVDFELRIEIVKVLVCKTMEPNRALASYFADKCKSVVGSSHRAQGHSADAVWTVVRGGFGKDSRIPGGHT
jgi:hypothetical protein